jgi:uncharacterized protein (DUF2164 family)
MIEFDKSTREALARSLAGYLKAEFDVEIGGMEAVVLLDFISERLGPHYYNQALYDGQARLRAKAEALGEALYELEKSAKP